ncbi:MAG: hypothetical protein HC848_03750 [Limnobacter sp.]|nr:hypothetical protein [Limnobacter sp.]
MEAQGNIIADYFAINVLKESSKLYETKYEKTQHIIDLYEIVLSEFNKNPSEKSNPPENFAAKMGDGNEAP